MKSKKCIKCDKTRLVKFFHNNKQSKDGLYTYCKKCKKEDDKIYSLNNRDKILLNKRQYYINNKDILTKKKKEYQQRTENKAKRKEYKRLYESNRKNNDHLYRLTQNYKNRISKALKGIGRKSKSTEQLLGCKVCEFKQHIENQFTSGMTWENQGEWHVDHIIPISSAKTLEEREFLFHYTNCQPLWAKDNLSKSDKIFSNA